MAVFFQSTEISSRGRERQRSGSLPEVRGYGVVFHNGKRVSSMACNEKVEFAKREKGKKSATR